LRKVIPSITTDNVSLLSPDKEGAARTATVSSEKHSMEVCSGPSVERISIVFEVRLVRLVDTEEIPA